MSARNFWTIFLKILGIWLVINGITTLTQFISAVSYLSFNEKENFLAFLYITVLFILIIGVYYSIFRFFVFKTSWLIDKLKLENGFAEGNIGLTMNGSSVIKIATIVIGGLIFIDSFPLFCKEIFNYFQQKRMFNENYSSGWIVLHFVKTVLGYLLMTNSTFVVRFIEKQDKEK